MKEKILLGLGIVLLLASIYSGGAQADDACGEGVSCLSTIVRYDQYVPSRCHDYAPGLCASGSPLPVEATCQSWTQGIYDYCTLGGATGIHEYPCRWLPDEYGVYDCRSDLLSRILVGCCPGGGGGSSGGTEDSSL